MTSTTDLTIRSATRDDAESISRLLTDLSREFVTPDYSPQGAAALTSRLTPAAIRRAVDDGTVYFVAEADDRLLGAIGVIPERRHLYHLFVDRGRHLQGIGRRLWNEVLSVLPPGPITVNSSRFAVAFYRRLGFVSTGPPWEKDGVISYPMRRTPNE